MCNRDPACTARDVLSCKHWLAFWCQQSCYNGTDKVSTCIPMFAVKEQQQWHQLISSTAHSVVRCCMSAFSTVYINSPLLQVEAPIRADQAAWTALHSCCVCACTVLLRGPVVHHKVLVANFFAFVQVNARKIYDEANVFSGAAANKLFTAILLGEATLQVTSALGHYCWLHKSACHRCARTPLAMKCIACCTCTFACLAI